jgi:SgrR family transcriptional regulator
MWTSCKTKGKIKTDELQKLISSFMRLIDQFHKIHALLEKQNAQPGLLVLAEALNCSERNARLLLRKMEEKGWLRWEATRGRGHFSRLTLLATPQQVSLDRLSGLLAEGELEQAFASLDGDQRKLLAARLPDFVQVPQADGSRDRLRIPLKRAVMGLDPLEILFALEAHLVSQIFARLVEFDRTTRQLVPALAHYWESEDDGKVWHFWLRPGLTFHDGSELEPQDVQQTILRLRDKPSPNQYLYTHLESVEVGGCRRVTCRLKTTDYLWPNYLAAVEASIIPRNRSSDFSLMPVGSGPFKLTRRSEYRLTLSAFEDYHRERALLDEIDLWVIAAAEETSEFDLHFGYCCEPSATQNTIAQILAGCTHVICNTNRPLFAKASQRLALADWLAPTGLIAKGDASRRPASGLLSTWEHRVAAPRVRRPPIPKGTTLTMVAILSPEHTAIAHLVKHRLEAAQIQVTLEVMPYEEYLRFDWPDSADLVVGAGAMDPDEDMGCYAFFASDTMIRRWMPANRLLRIDAKLQAIRATADAQTRMKEYAELGKQLVEEGWMIPISHEIRHVRVEAHVGGVKDLSFGHVPFADLWLR